VLSSGLLSSLPPKLASVGVFIWRCHLRWHAPHFTSLLLFTFVAYTKNMKKGKQNLVTLVPNLCGNLILKAISTIFSGLTVHLHKKMDRYKNVKATECTMLDTSCRLSTAYFVVVFPLHQDSTRVRFGKKKLVKSSIMIRKVGGCWLRTVSWDCLLFLKLLLLNFHFFAPKNF
jgi:hypothetical protein